MHDNDLAPMSAVVVVLMLAAGCGGPAPRTEVPAVAAAPTPSLASPTASPISSVRADASVPAPIIARISSSAPECGLDTEGHVWRWSTGALEPDAPSIHGARSIACAGRHSCLVAADGTAWCWGNNSYGALGDGTEEHREAPVRVVGLSSVAELGLDFDRTCARTSNGDVFCWGDSELGKAGDGRLPDNSGREKVAPGKAILGGASTLAVASAHACSVMPDGRVSCWGQNNAGACGQPLRVRYVARPAFVPNSKNLVAVSAGDFVTCTIDRDGMVACWGSAAHGVLGPARPVDELGHPTPTAVPLPAKAVEVAVGGGFVCARLSTGAVHCWGDNEYGQLGDGTTKERPTPAPVNGLAKATQISAGLASACALVEGGHVLCWGKEVWLRDPSRRADDSPVPVEMKLPLTLQK